jgi:CHAD domain-containing protein
MPWSRELSGLQSRAMEKQKILQITIGHFRRLRDLSKRIVPVFDPEAVHAFRVEYKKLRAFLRLLSEHQTVQDNIRLSGGLKKTYRAAGLLRGLQLQSQLIIDEKMHGCTEMGSYASFLDRETEKMKEELGILISRDPVKESKKRILVWLPGSLRGSDCHKFIKQKWGSAQAIVSARYFSDENLHEIRKNLKDIFYVLKYCKEKGMKRVHLDQLVNRADEYKDLTEDLGTYQDNYAAIALLASYLRKDAKANIPEDMVEVKGRWLREKRVMKQWLVRKLLKLGDGSPLPDFCKLGDGLEANVALH